MTKNEILDYLQENKENFQKQYNVEQIGLFGSYAREEATTNSDIDIFVKMKPNIFNLISVKDKIEEDLHKKVDIIREHKNIKPLFLEMIHKDIIYVQ